MPKFKYTGDDERVYLFPESFVVKPGDVVEAEKSPDKSRFEQVAAKTPTSTDSENKES